MLAGRERLDASGGARGVGVAPPERRAHLTRWACPPRTTRRSLPLRQATQTAHDDVTLGESFGQIGHAFGQ
jgi:hypothetical protein